ncbi:hypothetical protein ZHAS_00018757 [Anopheles sinensis]|uniref:Uncharacterized protein n=1 Tax=Anopheles sinensis TaxID=74873 RepID=A0A084WKH2_ANOSI|nr:hypothetical protein ZHAS_00018757 [Anopheles sinensis]
MGCSEWKTVRYKVRSVPTRNENSNRVDWFRPDGDNRPPAAEQLLQRFGQLKLDQTGSHEGRERPNGWLATLLQSVIL